MKMNEAYFRQFDSKIGYDGAVVRGGNSIEVRIMRCLGYFLYGVLLSLPIAYLLIVLFPMILEKIM
ncbi:hypothetical protein [Methanosarcina sp.]|uniref:hypothetical protein n=1 Tax=Methanosarcina sp. TaxID=2213 RepID=UPI002BB2568E|nr:hypothetical protein [Methanosarcina sp.]HOW14764.1 hypothetical protein [Methanosarcina sp.]